MACTGNIHAVVRGFSMKMGRPVTGSLSFCMAGPTGCTVTGLDGATVAADAAAAVAGAAGIAATVGAVGTFGAAGALGAG